MGDLTKQAQLLKKCVKLAVYIRSGREFVSILTMQPNNVLEKGAFFGRVSEQGKQYMIRRMIVKIRSNLTALSYRNGRTELRDRRSQCRDDVC